MAPERNRSPSRQLQFPGHVTASRREDRWVADVISLMSNPVETDGTFTNVLVIQDIFSRFLWAYAMQSKREVPEHFESLINTESRVPRELNTDRGTELTSAKLQALMQNLPTHPRLQSSPKKQKWVPTCSLQPFSHTRTALEGR